MSLDDHLDPERFEPRDLFPVHDDDRPHRLLGAEEAQAFARWRLLKWRREHGH